MKNILFALCFISLTLSAMDSSSSQTSAFGKSSRLTSADKFNRAIEKIISELTMLNGGYVNDHHFSADSLGSNSRKELEGFDGYTAVASDSSADAASSALVASIKTLYKLADGQLLNHQQYLKILEQLAFLAKKLASRAQIEAGAASGEKDINNFIEIARMIGDFQRYDPKNENLSQLLPAIKTITDSLELLIGYNKVSPFAFDYFDDLDMNIISHFLSISVGDNSNLETSKYQTIAELKNGVTSKSVLRQDARGNLIISVVANWGNWDRFDFRGQIDISSSFRLNGAHSVMNYAADCYSNLEGYFSGKSSGQNPATSIASYLARGKKVRLIGYGFYGLVAEVIAYQLKSDYFKANKNNDIGSDQNQIQAITFAPYSYLHSSSKDEFDRVIGPNILRFRFAKDTITNYASVENLNNIFEVKDSAKFDPYSAFDYHNWRYLQANLVNVNITKSFKRYLLLYKLLKVEHETLSLLAKSKDKEEIGRYLSQLNNLKASILSYYFDQRATDKDRINLIATLKIACDSLADLIAENNDSSKVLESISEMIRNKEILAKRNSLNDNIASDEMGVVGEIRGLLSELKNFSTGEDAFKKIIARVGQSPEMLLKYDQMISDTKLIEALVTFLVETEKIANQKQLDGIKQENPQRLDKYLKAMALGKLNLLVGGHFKEAGGQTGTKFVLDLRGKKIGIFKPKGQNALIKQFFGQASLLSPHEMAQPISECAAYKLSLDLELDLAPISIMTKLRVAGGEIEGAFIELFENMQTLDDVIIAKNQDQFSQTEIDRFQLMAIFDFVIANLDRHKDNLFVFVGGDLTTLKCIDDANAFIKYGPNTVNGHNMYLWSDYGVAKPKFSMAVLKYFNEHLTAKWVQDFKDYISKTYRDFFVKEILDFFDLRIAVLRKLTDQNSPEDLAKLKTRTAIEEWLK